MHIIFAQFYSHQPTPDYRIVAVELQKLGHTAWVVTPDEAGQLVMSDGKHIVSTLPPLQLPKGKLRRMPFVGKLIQKWFRLVHAHQVQRFLLKSQPDIVQLNPAFLEFFDVLPLLSKSRVRFILDWRQIDERDYEGRFGKLKNRLYRLRRQLVSKYVYQHAFFLHAAGAKRVLGVGWDKWASVIPLGIDPRFLQQSRQSDSETTAVAKKTRFVYLGTISKQRKLAEVLQAAQRIQRVRTDFEVVFIGPDATAGYYQSMADGLMLQSVVRFLPPIAYEDVPCVLTRFDVALAYVPERPLDWQYHPTLKALEYRALGMPMIATDFEPNREIVLAGENGLLIENSVDSLADAMLQFVQDASFLEQKRECAQKMRQGMLWHDVTKLYLEAYASLCNV